MEVFYALVLILAATIYILIKKRKRKFLHFKKLGIPGPEPSILWGNLNEINEKGFDVCQTEWLQKYGDMLGFYVGIRPYLMVAEPDALKDIQIKDASYFTDKDLYLDTFTLSDTRSANMLEILSGKRWKDMRSILSPTFSSGKVKEMYICLQDVINVAIAKIKSSLENKSMDFGDFYELLSIELSTYLFLGIKTDIQNNPKNPFYLSIKDFLKATFDDLEVKLMVSFPWTVFFFSKLTLAMERISQWKNEPSTSFIILKCEEAYKARIKMGVNKFPRKDALQILIESSMDTKSEDRRASPDDIVANATAFVVAGFETTKSVLSFMTHYLIHNQDLQERIRQEIIEALDGKEILPYDSLSRLQLLDQAFSEILRMYPPAITAVTRLGERDYTVNGKTIPKEIPAFVPTWGLHRSPKFWKNPNEFDIERFSAENKANIPSMVYQPFGNGPRFCIGQRLALVNVKSIIARLLAKYKIVKCPETDKEYPDLKHTMFILNPKNGVHGKCVPI